MHTTLTFIEDLPLYESEKPYRFVGFPNLPSEWQSNCKYIDQDNVDLLDARGHESSFTLSKAGFEFMKHESKCSLDINKFDTRGKDDPNLQRYLEESIELVKKKLGHKRVTCFDWRIRKNTETPSSIPTSDTSNVRRYAIPPASNIHCDFSPQGGWDRLAMHLSEKEMSEVEQGLWRVRFINVWRPLKLVQNAPLVLCDRQTVRPSDLIEVDKVLPEKVEYTLYLKHRDYHRWYILSDQVPQEVILFVTWDSLEDNACANIPPHGAGLHIGQEGTPARESVEVRLLVMTPIV